MGGDRVTVKNLKVLQVNKDTNTLVISGAVPGNKGGLLEIISQ
jgi:large subunit ribosomal protein L3